MPEQNKQWDPSQPEFVAATLRAIAALWALTSLVAVVAFRHMALGFFMGGLTAFVLFLVAMQAGMVIARGQQYGRALLVLLLKQLGIWIAVAVVLNLPWVNTVGFLLGVGALPVGIILALIWYALRRRRQNEAALKPEE